VEELELAFEKLDTSFTPAIATLPFHRKPGNERSAKDEQRIAEISRFFVARMASYELEPVGLI